MLQRFYEITIKTKGRGLYEFTRQLNELVNQSGLKNGIVTLNIQHTSASLVVQENADPSVRGDLERFFQTLIPADNSTYQHTIEGSDDMSAHIRSADTNFNLNHFERWRTGSWNMARRLFVGTQNNTAQPSDYYQYVR